MDEKVIEVRDLFQEVIPSFGIMHAKTYSSLMSGEIKTAKQVSNETGISHNKIYSVLKDLIKEKIISSTNTNPVSYHAKEPSKTYEKLVNKRILALEKKPEIFDKIIHDVEPINEREYIVRITNTQTKLFDNKNKAIVKESQEARMVLEKLSDYTKELNTKKEYAYATYR
ncbi:MAG: helix-turn-helix domain-containing protein [Candidatus Diapherotrites archaeon]